jgi:hypothetical protein
MDSKLEVGSLLPAKFVVMVGVTNWYLIEKFQ